MATKRSQVRWRAKNRYAKTQLNVMSRRLVHYDLDEIAQRFALRGKGEAVGFASFVTKGLIQYAEHDAAARRLLEQFSVAFCRERDLYK